MKSQSYILLFLLAGFLSLSSCSSDSSGGNTNPVNGERIKTMVQQELVSGTWRNLNKTTNTFEGDNKMMSSTLYQSWDSGTSLWVNSRQSTYTLYDNDHASMQLDKGWDTSTSSWTNQIRNHFTDDANGNRIKTETENWVTDQWKRSAKSEFIYDGSLYLIRNEISLWDTNSSTWTTPVNRIIYTNNAQGKPTLIETFVNNDTTPSSKVSFTYDSQGHVAFRLTESLFSGNWVVSNLMEYTNLSNGLPQKIHQTNYDTDGDITSELQYLYEYF